MSNAFRGPVEPATPGPDPVAPTDATEKPGEDFVSTNRTEEHSDTLLATYQEEKGKPYTAAYFDLPTMWDKDSNTKNELATIEGFLKEKVSKGELENSTRAAATYLKELEKKAETNRYESTTNRINKILAYIEFQRVVHG